MSSLRNRQREHRQAPQAGGFTWREIDVDSDAKIRRLYNDEVPVVFINGRKAFKYRMDEQEFLRKLSA
jgi:glutaredoxin